MAAPRAMRARAVPVSPAVPVARGALARVLAAAAVAVLALAGGCKRGGDEPATGSAAAPVIGEAELERARDACKAYVERMCACAQSQPGAAALQERCALARALPESIEVATQVSAHPSTERADTRQAADAIRKTVARCIEQTAELPSLGCP